MFCSEFMSGSSHPSFTNDQKADLSAKGITDLTGIQIQPTPVLILSGNQLTSFTGLQPNEDLSVLQADNNKIESIPPKSFENTPNIQTLILSNNLMTKISSLAGLKSLRSLYFTSNRISVLENLEQNQCLRQLFLSKNKIHSIFLRTPLVGLTILDLRYNMIDKINFGSYFPNLVSLHLDHCFLNSFEGVNDFKQLKRLSLSYNKICDNHNVLDLPLLESLNVSNNSLVTLSFLSKLPSLVTLDISSNPIADQGISTSIKLKNLRTLRASETQIVHPNLILRFAQLIEVLDFAFSWTSRIQDIQALIGGCKCLRVVDFRGSRVNAELYPDIPQHTSDARQEYASITDYDLIYPETAADRTKYRKQVLQAACSQIEVLDGIHILQDEAKYIVIKKGKVIQPDLDQERSERRETRTQTKFAEGSETDIILQTKLSQNAAYRQEQDVLEHQQNQQLITSINQLLEEQNQIRSFLNLSIKSLPNLSRISYDDLLQMEQNLRNENQQLQQQANKYQRNSHSSEQMSELERVKRENLLFRQQLEATTTTANDENEQILQSLEEDNKELEKQLLKAKRPKHHHRRKNPKPAPADESKIKLVQQLMSTNALLRNQLGIKPLNYASPEGFNEDEIDQIIGQYMDANQNLQGQLEEQQQRIKAQNSKMQDPLAPKPSNRQITRHEMYQDLEGNTGFCSFWVPLSVEAQKKQQNNYNNQMRQLPVPVLKKPKKCGCSKCTKTILMMARVPPYPPDSSKIMDTSDEFQLVESWVVTSLNMRVNIQNLFKGLFYWRFIENERTMHNLNLVVYMSPDSPQLLQNGVDSAIIVADHMRYVSKQLKAGGQAQILICALDVGNQAVNYCEHTALPNIQEMQAMNQTYDTLLFNYQNDEAIYVLDPSRLVPLYSTTVTLVTK